MQAYRVVARGTGEIAWKRPFNGNVLSAGPRYGIRVAPQIQTVPAAWSFRLLSARYEIVEVIGDQSAARELSDGTRA